MSLFSFLFPQRQGTAAIARDRLKIVLAHERASRDAPDFLPGLQKELIEVVGRYVEIRDDTIRVNVGKSGETSTLEINIELDGAKLKVGTGKPVIVASANPGAAAAGRPAKPVKSG
ncbi:MAG: cell division topological specificity factor MinE [Alphaproteobacteria bacterium]|nr:cell division topological specificity factor MinE [Alphaproteobacteria bacterium]MBV9860821.1 cell division topological specificity factor MinE [Alphaproteobacteria bacterium]